MQFREKFVHKYAILYFYFTISENKVSQQKAALSSKKKG